MQQLQRFPAASRPHELGTWLKTGKRSVDKVPVVNDAHAYGTQWVKWWMTAQPKERNAQKWPFSRDANASIGWGKFPANGKDGMFVAVMAMSWWATSVRSPEEVLFFEEAVADIHWVIQELIRFKTADPLSPPPSLSPQDEPSSHPPAPPSDPRTSSSRPPVSTLNVFAQRGAGKRVVKPTEKARAIS